MQDSSTRILWAVRETRRAFVRDLLAATTAERGVRELTLSQLAALVILSGGESLAIGAMAGLLRRSTSATSRLLDQLVRRRLLVRGEDPEDRRGRKVALAARGRALVDGLLARRAEAQVRLMERLAPADRQIAERGLVLLAEAAQRRGSR